MTNPSNSQSGVSAEASNLIAQMNQDFTNALSAIDNQQNPVSFVTAAATAANQATQDYWNDIDTELSSLSSNNPATMTTVMAQIQSDLTGIQSIMQAQQAFAEAETQKSFQLAQQYGNVGNYSNNSGTGTGSYTGTGTGRGKGTGYGGVGYGGVGYRGTGYRGTGYGGGRYRGTGYGGGRYRGTGYGGGRYGSGGYGGGGLGGLLGGGSGGLGGASSLSSLLPLLLLPELAGGFGRGGGGFGGGGYPPGGYPPPGANPPGALAGSPTASATQPTGATTVGSGPGSTDGGSHTQPVSDTGTQPASGQSPGNPVPVSNEVKLPDGTNIQAPNGQAATAVRAAMDGANPADAYQQAGVTLPPPGTPILNPIAPGDLQMGDIGVWKDHQVMALGGGKVLVDGQVQPESTLGSSPDFLGWMRPTQSSQAPPAAPPPAPAPPATATAASVPTGAGTPPS